MKEQIMDYEVTSFSHSANSNKAQITVTVGEGGERRSFTRHLHRQGGRLMGLNIDPRAIPLNERRESELAEANRKLATAEQSLSNLIGKLELAEDAELVDDAAIAEILAKMQAADTTAIDATAAVAIAEANLDIVRLELPLMMSFDTTN